MWTVPSSPQTRCSPRARPRPWRLQGAGIAFAITSGRPPRGMAMLVGPLALKTPVAGFNGGIFVKPDMTVIEEHVCPPTSPTGGRDHPAQRYGYLGLRASDWLIRDPLRPMSRMSNRPSSSPRPSSIISRGFKARSQDRRRERRSRQGRAVREGCESRLGAAASAVRSQPYYLDVTHPDANKGSSARCRSVSPSLRTHPHDRRHAERTLMFRKSGLSIAMGNASPRCKRRPIW